MNENQMTKSLANPQLSLQGRRVIHTIINAGEEEELWGGHFCDFHDLCTSLLNMLQEGETPVSVTT